MHSVLAASWMSIVVCAALSGCIDAPSEESAACVEHADCGGCGRCVNGQCVHDQVAFAQASCKTEDKDPCNGLDDDHNGVIDDPESCWVAVYEVADATTGLRCLVSESTAASSPCAAPAASTEPSFYLAKNPIPDTVPVRQCVSASDAVLVFDPPLTDESTAGRPAPLEQPRSAYEALGYVCGAPLGYAFVSPFEGEGELGRGRRCPLNEYIRPPADGDFGAHRYILGSDASAATGACDPRATRYVVTPGPCGPTPPESCAFDDCALWTEATLDDPPEPRVVAPGATFDVTFTLRNTGDTSWESGWILLRVAHPLDQIRLDDDVPPGAEVAFTVTTTAPDHGVDLVDPWELRSLDGTAVPIVDGEDKKVVIPYTVVGSYAGHVVSMVPEFGERKPPGAIFEAEIRLKNVGKEPWSAGWRVEQTHGKLAGVSAITLDEDVDIEEVVTLRIPMKISGTFVGGLESWWQLVDGDGHAVPIDGTGKIRLRLHVVGRDEARFLGETIPDDVVVVPGTVFVKMWRFRNDGETTWGTGWSFRRVDGELGLAASAPVTEPVPPGTELTLAVPMFVPVDGGGQWRESWKLVNAEGGVVAVTGDRPDGVGEFIGAGPNWWFWAQISAETPCLSATAPR